MCAKHTKPSLNPKKEIHNPTVNYCASYAHSFLQISAFSLREQPLCLSNRKLNHQRRYSRRVMGFRAYKQQRTRWIKFKTRLYASCCTELTYPLHRTRNPSAVTLKRRQQFNELAFKLLKFLLNEKSPEARFAIVILEATPHHHIQHIIHITARIMDAIQLCFFTSKLQSTFCNRNVSAQSQLTRTKRRARSRRGKGEVIERTDSSESASAMPLKIFNTQRVPKHGSTSHRSKSSGISFNASPCISITAYIVSA